MITTAQAAQITGAHPTTVRRWCRAGRVEATRTPRGWQINPASLAGRAAITITVTAGLPCVTGPAPVMEAIAGSAITITTGQWAGQVVRAERRETWSDGGRVATYLAATRHGRTSLWLDRDALAGAPKLAAALAECDRQADAEEARIRASHARAAAQIWD